MVLLKLYTYYGAFMSIIVDYVKAAVDFAGGPGAVVAYVGMAATATLVLRDQLRQDARRDGEEKPPRPAQVGSNVLSSGNPKVV